MAASSIQFCSPLKACSSVRKNQVALLAHQQHDQIRLSSSKRSTLNALFRDAYGYAGDDGGSRVVDENMIILRMRIHDVKRMEMRTNLELPSNWMEWEKKYYASCYRSDICQAVGFLQNQLMNTRPSLALGMLVLLVLSLPCSMALLILEIAKWIQS